MPRRGTSCAAHLAKSKPSNSRVPALFRASPMMVRSRVVLPSPFLPSRAAQSPRFTPRLTPWRMCSLSMWTWTSSSLSMGGLLDVVLVLVAAEIGLAHALVSGDVLWDARSQDRPLRHHRNIVGDLEHDLHVMLDDDDVDGARELADLVHCALSLRRAHAAGRLVEEKKPWRGDHRHADLEQRHVAIGQGAGLPVGERRKANLREGVLHCLSGLAVRHRGTERMQRAVPGAPGDPEIFGDGELREYALDLQGPLDAQPADLVRPQPGDVLAAEENAAGTGC